MRRMPTAALLLLLLLIGCARSPAAPGLKAPVPETSAGSDSPTAPAVPPPESTSPGTAGHGQAPPDPDGPAPVPRGVKLRATLRSIENQEAEVSLTAPDERRYALQAPFCGGSEGNPVRSGHYSFSLESTGRQAVTPFGEELLTFNDSRSDMLEVLPGKPGSAPDLLLVRQYATCNGSEVAALALTPDGRRLVHLRWRREDGSATAVLFASRVEALRPGVIRTTSYNNAEGIWSTITWAIRPEDESLSAVKTVRSPIRGGEAIVLGSEVYAIPFGVAPGDLVWAAGPDRIYWAVRDPWAPSPVRATPRRPGRSDLADGAVDLLPGTAGRHEGGAARVTSITLADAWLIYTTAEAMQAQGSASDPATPPATSPATPPPTPPATPPAPAPGPDPVQDETQYRILAANLADLSGGNQLLAAISSVGQGFRLLTAAGDGHVAWQITYRIGPGARYTLSTAGVHRLADGAEWEVPDLPRADSLRVEHGAMVAALPDGSEVRRPLSPPPQVKAFPGQEVLLAEGSGVRVFGTAAARGRFTDLYAAVGESGARLPVQTTGDVWQALVADLGAPVVIAAFPGGSMGSLYRAYLVDGEQVLPLSWGHAEFATGFLTLDPATHTAVVAGRSYGTARQMRYTAYTLRDGRLEAEASW